GQLGDGDAVSKDREIDHRLRGVADYVLDGYGETTSTVHHPAGSICHRPLSVGNFYEPRRSQQALINPGVGAPGPGESQPTASHGHLRQEVFRNSNKSLHREAPSSMA